ncbi:MAG TPA: hypothetical protein VGI07_12095, partial [Solirubrobacteraceae bacterium]
MTPSRKVLFEAAHKRTPKDAAQSDAGPADGAPAGTTPPSGPAATPTGAAATRRTGSATVPAENGPAQRGAKKSFNEAAHKLGHWPMEPVEPRQAQEPSEAIKAASDDQRDVVASAGKLVLALGALGIVYG